MINQPLIGQHQENSYEVSEMISKGLFLTIMHFKQFDLRNSAITRSNRLNKIIVFLVIFSFSSSLTAKNDLKPRKVVIESSYQEKNLRPPSPLHEFDLQYPGSTHEPYFPDLQIDEYPLPSDFPQNVQISWLTNFSGGLAELFLGDKGELENAILFYQKGELVRTRLKLQSLLNQNSELEENTTLWLAWTLYKEKKYAGSLRLLGQLHQSRSYDLIIESYYLASLIFIKQKQFKHHYQLIQRLKKRVMIPSWDFRLNLAYIISLTELGYWTEADAFLKTSNLKTTKHAKLYYLVEEIIGRLDYAQNRHGSSLIHYLNAQKYQPNLYYQRNLNRNIAWLYYFSGNFEKSLEVTNLGLDFFQPEATEEIVYLKLACLVKLKHWDEVNSILNLLNPESVFFTYGAFQIRSNLKEIDQYKELKDSITAHEYSEPNMKFYAALHEGNNAFVEKKYQKAEQQYIRALSVDIKSSDYWMVQYNLGLVHLRQKRFDEAINIFDPLLKNYPKLLPDAVSYHLLFAIYNSEKDSAFLETLKRINPEKLNSKQQIDITMMKGGVFADKREYKAAVKEFLEIWQQNQVPVALEFAIRVLYAQRGFDQIIKLVQVNQRQNSDTLYFYHVKAHLGKKDIVSAYQLLKDREFSDVEFIQVRIEVLLAAQKFQELIDTVGPLLSKTSDPENRLLLYLSLGDANFNLKQYVDSKHQFYKALKIANSIEIRSLILYNIALITLYENKNILFEKEITSILEKENLTDEIRYTLTQMLVDYYWQNKKTALADQVLEHYTNKFKYQKSNATAKRIRFLYQAEEFNSCYQLAKNRIDQQQEYNRRDRVIMTGYCGNQTENVASAVAIVQNELSTKSSDYRKNELTFVLSQGYFQLKQYKKSYDLSEKLLEKPLKLGVKHETQILMAKAAMLTDNPRMAEEVLGDLNQYRQTQKYPKSLRIRALLALSEKNTDLAVRTYLRLYYLSKTTAGQKQDILLDIAELYIDRKMINEADEFIKRVNIETGFEDQNVKKRFNRLRARIGSN